MTKFLIIPTKKEKFFSNSWFQRCLSMVGWLQSYQIMMVEAVHGTQPGSKDEDKGAKNKMHSSPACSQLSFPPSRTYLSVLLLPIDLVRKYQIHQWIKLSINQRSHDLASSVTPQSLTQTYNLLTPRHLSVQIKIEHTNLQIAFIKSRKKKKHVPKKIK